MYQSKSPVLHALLYLLTGNKYPVTSSLHCSAQHHILNRFMARCFTAALVGIAVLLILCNGIHSYSWRRCGFQRYRKLGMQLHAESSIKAVDAFVSDISKSSPFYSSILHSVSTDLKQSATFKLLPTAATMLHLHGVDTAAVSGKRGALGESFAGIGITTSHAAPVIKRLVDLHGAVEMPLDNYKYGASMEPDEDDLKTTPVRCGTLRDPDGYLVEVHEPLQPDSILSSSVSATTVKKGKTSKKKADVEEKVVESSVTDVPVLAPAVAKVILHVEDLDESIAFYTKTLGMKLLRKRSNVNNTPKEAAMVAYVGYDSETEGVFIELKYLYATDKINHGTHPCKIHIGVEDLGATLAAVKDANQEAILEEDGTAVVSDPSGYQVYLSRS